MKLQHSGLLLVFFSCLHIHNMAQEKHCSEHSYWRPCRDRHPPHRVVGGFGPIFLDWSGVVPLISSSLDTGSFVPYYMVALIFLWTPPHFWALALYKSKEYHDVGIPMMPGVKGSKRTILEMRIYGCLLFLISFVGPHLIFSGNDSIASIFFLIGSLFVATWYVRTLCVGS